jgi:hypothetical protein
MLDFFGDLRTKCLGTCLLIASNSQDFGVKIKMGGVG